MTEPNVLLTGATGFVGAYTLRLLLKNGYAVRALRRPNSPTDLVRDVADQVEWVEADVTDLMALESAFGGIRQVCHCAALVSFHPKDYRRMHQINVEGTANMVNLALEAGVEKFVHVSSIAAFGRVKERPRLDENAKWVRSAGNSQYAISKYLAEQEVWRGHAEGLQAVIVNPSAILGSGFWNNSAGRVFLQVYKGLKFWTTGHTGVVDVRDVATFILRMLQSDITGERYILNAENVSFRELIFMVADALEVNRPIFKVNPPLAEIAWRVEWLKEKLLGIEPIVTKESARASVSSFYYDNAKSLTIPGFSYRPLPDTVRQTAAQLREAAGTGFDTRMLEF